MLGALTMQRLLLKMREVKASDLHIKIGSPPVLRVAAILHRVDSPELTADDTSQLLKSIIPPHLEETLAKPNWQWGERLYSVEKEPTIKDVVPR